MEGEECELGATLGNVGDSDEHPPGDGGIVELNVGGSHFSTTLQTLRAVPTSMLARMFHFSLPLLRDARGRIFLDRSPTYFGLVLDFLRDGVCHAMPETDAGRQAFRAEAMFYCITPLVEAVDAACKAAGAADAASEGAHLRDVAAWWAEYGDAIDALATLATTHLAPHPDTVAQKQHRGRRGHIDMAEEHRRALYDVCPPEHELMAVYRAHRSCMTARVLDAYGVPSVWPLAAAWDGGSSRLKAFVEAAFARYGLDIEYRRGYGNVRGRPTGIAFTLRRPDCRGGSDSSDAEVD